MKILLVEDDLATRTMLENVSIERHYQVETTGDGRSALKLAQEVDYDLILLDVNIPELDGISVCRRLREQGCQIPILLLTAKDEIADRVIGLDAGADDYAIKPFSVPELFARIRALLRRGRTTFDSLAPSSGRKILIWEDLELNCQTHHVTYGGRALRLTPKEYGILELLLFNPQRVFSRSALIVRLWELEATPTERTIDSHIKSVRSKLKQAGATQDPIETMYGFGYRLRRLESDLATTDLADPNDADALMWELWQQFKDSFHEQIDLLTTTAQSYTDGLTTFVDPEYLQELKQSARQVAHKLVGSLGVYGFPSGSTIARKIEDLLHPHLDLTAADLPQMTQLIADLQQELTTEPIFGNQTSLPVVPPISEDRPGLPLVTSLRECRRSHCLAQSRLAKVMIVDDDVAILDRSSVVLSTWGLQVISLADPQHFWAQLTHTSPDLLILDIEMPEFSGIELCQAVRNHPKWGNLPILLIATSPDPETILQAFAAGGDDYIRKPILEPELIARVLNQLEPRQLRRSNLMPNILEQTDD
jgi:DNA-binding response OmpR family regulator